MVIRVKLVGSYRWKGYVSSLAGPGAEEAQPDHRERSVGGFCRLLGQRQVDFDPAPPALLRSAVRLHPCRWRGVDGFERGLVAQSAGSRGPGACPFRHEPRRQREVWLPGGDRSPGARSSEGGQHGLRLWGQQWLRVVGREHWCSEVDGPSRTPWGEALRRTEAARGHRPGAVAGAPVHAPGRGHVGPRLRVGEAGAAGDAGDKDGQDNHHRGPSSLHNPKLGQDLRALGRTPSRVRHLRRAHQLAWQLRHPCSRKPVIPVTAIAISRTVYRLLSCQERHLALRSQQRKARRQGPFCQVLDCINLRGPTCLAKASHLAASTGGAAGVG